MLSLCGNSSGKSWKNQKDPQRITKSKTFINNYNWEGINFSPEKVDWKKFAKNNVTIALNILNAKKEKRSIPLMFQKITQIMKNKLFFQWFQMERDGIIFQ